MFGEVGGKRKSRSERFQEGRKSPEGWKHRWKESTGRKMTEHWEMYGSSSARDHYWYQELQQPQQEPAAQEMQKHHQVVKEMQEMTLRKSY